MVPMPRQQSELSFHPPEPLIPEDGMHLLTAIPSACTKTEPTSWATEAVSMLIIGIGGTQRTGSSSEVCLRLALQGAEQHGAETACFSGPALSLPHYN